MSKLLQRSQIAKLLLVGTTWEKNNFRELRSAICLRNTVDVQELKNKFEKNLLLTLTDPLATILLMLTTKIRSSHASNEEYISKERHNYIRVSFPYTTCYYTKC